MLVNAKGMLDKALAGHYAVPQFNINDLEWTKSVLLACEEVQSPVILGVSEGAGKYMTGFKTVAAMVKAMVEELGITVPVALHLDHGTYDGAKACIEAGFSSIMFDGSHYPIEENTEEDNWRFVEASQAKTPLKPESDDDPKYEDIPQGQHDPNETRWNQHDVRRYAYWSVFAGSFGHSYGHNVIMQFIRPGYGASFGADGHKKAWWDALEDPGFNQMKYLKNLMLSFPYFERVPDQSVIAGTNGNRYDRAIATRGKDYLLVYNYSGNPMSVDLTKISGAKKKVWWYSPKDGKLSFIGEFDSKITPFTYDGSYNRDNDQVLIAIDSSKNYISTEWLELPMVNQ